MPKPARLFLLFIIIGIGVGLNVHFPGIFSDKKNTFLRDFLDVDLLAVLGFVASVSIASASSIMIHLNQLSDVTEVEFVRTRRSLRNSALTMVIAFVIALGVVVGKPVLPQNSVYTTSANFLALLTLLVSTSVLWDLTMTVFKIPSARKIAEGRKAAQKQSGL